MRRVIPLARLAVLTVSFIVVPQVVTADPENDSRGRFVRLWWYEPGIEHGNPVTNRRFRVNAPEAVLHPQFGQRSETKSSGMLQILMPENLLQIGGAELYLELWCGHPGTVNRRMTINGRTTYTLPGATEEHCSHAYPLIALQRTDLVQGHNALQFACDKGTANWGHFIVDQACLRAELPADHADLNEAKLDGFQGAVAAQRHAADPEIVHLSLDIPAQFAERVAAVEFQGRYDGYDENGDGKTNDWHGFTKTREPVAHLGTADKAPFDLNWDLRMLPAQENMAVRAVVHFRDLPNVNYVTPAAAALATPARGGASVRLFASKDLPKPFWSRANRLKTCTIDVDVDPANIEQAELHVVTWDGGKGTVENYFTLNGRPLQVAGNGRHDTIYSRVKLQPGWLKRGANRIELLSDTEHHGIEVLLPGPAMMVRTRGAGGAGRASPRDFERHALAHEGDARRGRDVFLNEQGGKCVVCHKVNGQGGEAGPDLSHIGGKFDRPHLIESLLEPSRQIVEGFRSTVVQTTDGQVLTGVIKERGEQQIGLFDAAGKKIVLRTADIQQRKDSPLSLMPQNVTEALSPEQCTDLIAYLETLRSGGKPTPGSAIAGPIKLPPGFEVRTIATGLTGCTALEATPDGRLLVCEQIGALRVVKDGKLLDAPMLQLLVDRTWERGLIGVTVDPDFPRTPHVYVCYVAREPNPHHVVSRFTVDGDIVVAGSERILLEGDDQRKLGGKIPWGHQGGALHFGRDGKLYIAIGEQTAETPAQRLDTFQGKILRINRDGSIPDDNPFVSEAVGKYRAIWARGCRNPFTFAVRPQTGELWINDVGGKFEEVNRGVAGGNFGWPAIEHGPTTDARFVGPAYHYPQASIAGGDFCPRESAWPDNWRGRYFFADFAHGWIKVLDPDHPEQAETFATGLSRPVDFRFASDGSLYVLLRNAWVIDDKFQAGTSALLEIAYKGMEH